MEASVLHVWRLAFYHNQLLDSCQGAIAKLRGGAGHKYRSDRAVGGVRHAAAPRNRRWNPNYWTALYHFEEEDQHFFNRKDKSKCNWMPKHEEIALMLESLLQVEGAEKRLMLKEMFVAAK